jgi:hypothetical protein
MDFGCGVAQPSISLAEYLQNKGKKVKLVLVDIPTIRFEFLEWFCKDKGIDTAFCLALKKIRFLIFRSLTFS